MKSDDDEGEFFYDEAEVEAGVGDADRAAMLARFDDMVRGCSMSRVGMGVE